MERRGDRTTGRQGDKGTRNIFSLSSPLHVSLSSLPRSHFFTLFVPALRLHAVAAFRLHSVPLLLQRPWARIASSVQLCEKAY